jgi:LacI family transcriptional regulator
LARSDQPLVTLAFRLQQDPYVDPVSVTGLNAEVVRCMLTEAGLRGWRLVDLDIADGLLQEQRPVGALIGWIEGDPRLAELRSIGCPIVRIGRMPHPIDAEIPAVIPDHREAGRMVADYYAQRGFRELAIFGHKDMGILPPIEEGFREIGEARGCRCHRFQFESLKSTPLADATPEQKRIHRAGQLASWLESLPKPVGLLSCLPNIGASISLICRRVGLSVPEDVAVMILGNNPTICDLSAVPVSAVDTDQSEMARVAIRLLDDLIHGRPAPPLRTYVAPRGIITRRSTDILAVDHPLVVRTVRFIWDHLDQNLSVDDIASEMDISRYKLERLFRQHFKRGINAELRRVRLERCRELLRTTDLAIHEVAERVGFNSAAFLHKTFRKVFGITPRHYRLQHRRREATEANQSDADETTDRD